MPQLIAGHWIQSMMSSGCRCGGSGSSLSGPRVVCKSDHSSEAITTLLAGMRQPKKLI